MAKITPEEISKMAGEIKAFLMDWGLVPDISIFYNGIRCIDVKNADGKLVWKEEPGLPQDYCKYVAKDHILTMLYEGPLYSLLNGYWEDEIYPIERVRNFPPHVRQKICEEYPQAEYLWKYSEEYLKKVCGYPEKTAKIKETLEFLSSAEYDKYEDYLTEKQKLESELEDMLSDIAELEREIGWSDSLGAEEVLQMSIKGFEDLCWWNDAEELLNDLTGGITELMWKIREIATREFDAVFDRYHVWFEFGNGWNLTCFDEYADSIYLEMEENE